VNLNDRVDRRTFLKSAAVAGVGIPLAASLPGCVGEESTVTFTKNNTVTSPPITTTVTASPITITSPPVTTTVSTTVTAPPVTTTKAPTAPAVVPSSATVVEAIDGTELMLQAVAAQGVKKIFFNGGTDNYHWMEAVAKFKALGRPTPDIVMTTHEHTGLCAAAGYFQWTQKPQFLVLHVALGTMQPGGSWEEIWKSNAGVVVLAGTPGQTTKGELGYTNRGGIQFLQEIYNQEGMLGSYAKWSYKIERVENSALIINRAFQMAGSEPCGVAYMTYPMEVAEAPLEGGLAYPAAAYAPATGAQGDSDALKAAAKLLVQAKNPVVLVKGMGRHPEAVASLVALAEKLALPVASSDVFMNFPTTHWARSSASTATRDVILVIDHDAPWTTAANEPTKTATIITMDVDPMQGRAPMNGTQSHLPITCNSALALPVLTQLCDQFITAERTTAFAERKAALTAAKATSDAASATAIKTASTAMPLSTTWIRECVNQITDENTVLLWDIGNIGQGAKSQPGHVFAMWSANLGTSMPRGIGIKLAAPNKMVISSAGDGCTLYSEFIQCLQLARMYKAPTLHIVNNNNRWNAVQSGLAKYGGANSYAAKAGYNGSAIKPSPDFAGIAKAMGAYGEKVTDPAVLPAALQRALTAVKGGQSAVLDTVIVTE
jgi:acetolactate synthase-1/2/3 large subunit